MSGAVETLAREIGAPFRPEMESHAALVGWTHGLAMALRALRSNPEIDQTAHDAVDPLLNLLIAVTDDTTRSHPSRARSRVKLIKNLIGALDDEDGWPACRWMNALKCICLGLTIGIEDGHATRWPAQAGMTVAEMFIAPGRASADSNAARKAWLCFLFKATVA